MIWFQVNTWGTDRSSCEKALGRTATLTSCARKRKRRSDWDYDDVTVVWWLARAGLVHTRDLYARLGTSHRELFFFLSKGEQYGRWVGGCVGRDWSGGRRERLCEKERDGSLFSYFLKHIYIIVGNTLHECVHSSYHPLATSDQTARPSGIGWRQNRRLEVIENEKKM